MGILVLDKGMLRLSLGNDSDPDVCFGLKSYSFLYIRFNGILIS